jgi:hypothetical protein
MVYGSNLRARQLGETGPPLPSVLNVYDQLVQKATEPLCFVWDVGGQALGIFPIGMAVFICHLIAIPLTGCGINPARSFGPGIIAYSFIDPCDNVMDDHWVFWLAPFLGAAIAAIGYDHLVQDHEQNMNLRETFHNDAYRKNGAQTKTGSISAESDQNLAKVNFPTSTIA